MEKDIKDLLTELFTLIGIKVEIKVTEEALDPTTASGEKLYKVEIDPGESAGLLIGARGMTLSAIQSFVAIAVKQKTGEWVKISLDVAGWSEKQNVRLTELAENAADRVRQTSEPQMLYNLNPVQRRVVHMALQGQDDIETISEGEGQDRYLVVRLKK